MQSRAKSCLWPWKLPDLEGEGKSSLSHPLEGSHNQGVSPSFPEMKHTTRASSKWEDRGLEEVVHDLLSRHLCFRPQELLPRGN